MRDSYEIALIFARERIKGPPRSFFNSFPDHFAEIFIKILGKVFFPLSARRKMRETNAKMNKMGDQFWISLISAELDPRKTQDF